MHKKPIGRETVSKITTTSGSVGIEVVSERTKYAAIHGCCRVAGVDKETNYSLTARTLTDVLIINGIGDVEPGIPVYQTILETFKYEQGSSCGVSSCVNPPERWENTNPPERQFFNDYIKPFLP